MNVKSSQWVTLAGAVPVGGCGPVAAVFLPLRRELPRIQSPCATSKGQEGTANVCLRWGRYRPNAPTCLAKFALARRLCAMALRKARDGDGSSVCRGYVASRKATGKPVQARNDLRRHIPPGTAASDEI